MFIKNIHLNIINNLLYTPLIILSLNTIFCAERPANAPRSKAFDASAFLASLDAPPVAIDNKQKPAEVVGAKPRRRVFDASVFLKVGPVVAADAPRGSRKAFDASAFLKVGPVVAANAPRGSRKAFDASAFMRQQTQVQKLVETVPSATNVMLSQIACDPKIIRLIDAIPGSVVRLPGADLRAVTNLAQRDAIRAFVDAIGGLPNAAKEVCMNVLIARKINQIIPPQIIRAGIQRLIDEIPLAPVIANRIATMLDQNPQIRACQRAIGQLPDIEQDAHYQTLMTRIRAMVPTFTITRLEGESDAELRERTERIAFAFKTAHEKLIDTIINNRVAAITPLREVLPLDPMVANLPIENDLAQALVAAPDDPNNHAFEARLKRFLTEHWSTYYKPKRVVTGVGNVEALLQGKFDDINRGFGSIAEKKKQKVALVESILHKVYQEHNPEVRNRIREMGIDADVPDPTLSYPDIFADSPQFQAFLQNDYSYIGSLENAVRLQPLPSHIYTNMEKIKELPSANWDEILNNHVFNIHPDWRRGVAEDEAIYWRRIGNIVIDIYNRKIKPHLYPDDLAASLAVGVQMPLIPFRAMFSDANDATYADDGIFTYEERAAQDLARPGRERPDFDLKIERAAKAAREPVFRGQVEQSYKKVHDYTMKSLAQLFGTLHPIRAGLNWDWCAGGFDAERVELCKKAVLIFSYFDRADASWDNDFFDVATLVARFTHCPDGKKTAIEATSTRALNALGGDGGALVAEDFDTFIKKIVLNNFKGNAISALASHEHAENVSIFANIKYRHQGFWNVPSAVQAQFPRYYETDYYLGDDNATDRLLQYFYQHIYVGPHELVNTIYNYLNPDDVKVDADEGEAPPADADEAQARKIYRKAEAIEKRRNAFVGLVSTMLTRLRPFTEWEEELIDYTPLLQERYCTKIDPTPEVIAAAETVQAPEPEAHYLFTRKGIEMILFYAGYLAWNGAPHEHPLRADWVENLAWLRANEPQKYYVLYGN